jgi:hypothetical protein
VIRPIPAIRNTSASGNADWWNEVKTRASPAPVAASRAVSASIS